MYMLVCLELDKIMTTVSRGAYNDRRKALLGGGFPKKTSKKKKIQMKASAKSKLQECEQNRKYRVLKRNTYKITTSFTAAKKMWKTGMQVGAAG